MAGILFSFAETFQELEIAKSLVGQFLQNKESVFSQVRAQLTGLRDQGGGANGIAWKIPMGQPLRTIVSHGEYGPSGKGSAVVGTLSFLWEISRVPPSKRREPAQHFQLTGIASTVARVLALNDDGSDGDELAMWRVEIGDDASPGCHFHVQIRGESDDGPFPKKLPIPRLPGCLATPMTALEFMIGELFQERWKRHVFSDSNDLKRWRSMQRERLLKLFKWQVSTVQAATQSPWAALKAAKPPRDIFIA